MYAKKLTFNDFRFYSRSADAFYSFAVLIAVNNFILSLSC